MCTCCTKVFPNPNGRPGRQAWSAHVGVAVVGGRGEELLEGAGAGPAGQVEERARLVVGAPGRGAAEGLLADDGAGGLVVDVEVARGKAEHLGRAGNGRAVLG